MLGQFQQPSSTVMPKHDAQRYMNTTSNLRPQRTETRARNAQHDVNETRNRAWPPRTATWGSEPPQVTQENIATTHMHRFPWQTNCTSQPCLHTTPRREITEAVATFWYFWWFRQKIWILENLMNCDAQDVFGNSYKRFHRRAFTENIVLGENWNLVFWT